MYRVTEDFVDLKDSRYEYHRGDEFPRGGVSVSEDRITELASSKNLCRRPLIEEVVETTNEVTEVIPEEVEETTPEVVEEQKTPKDKKKRASK